MRRRASVPTQALQEDADRPSLWPGLHQAVGYRIPIRAVPLSIVSEDVVPQEVPGRRHEIRAQPGMLARLPSNRTQAILGGHHRDPRKAFGIHIHRQKVQIHKHQFAEFYLGTYRSILRRIAHAPMVQVDETKANILDATGYVWVFAAQDDVAFVYTGSRDGSILGRVLEGF